MHQLIRTFHTASLLLLAIGASGVALAQETQVATQLFSADSSPKSACEAAKLKLWQNAVERQCGSTLLDGRLRTKSESQDKLTIAQIQLQNGRVIDWAEQDRDVSLTKTDAGDIGRCRVKGTVKVFCETQSPKKLSEFQAKLSDYTLKSGQVLTIDIEPAPESYFLHVFSILPSESIDRQVQLLVPNHLASNTEVQANTKLDLGKQHQIVASLPIGKAQSEEALLLVKSIGKLAPPPGKMRIDQLNKWLTTIPYSDRQETLIGYQIVRSSE
jgi:hypothetical protein